MVSNIHGTTLQLEISLTGVGSRCHSIMIIMGNSLICNPLRDLQIVCRTYWNKGVISICFPEHLQCITFISNSNIFQLIIVSATWISSSRYIFSWFKGSYKWFLNCFLDLLTTFFLEKTQFLLRQVIRTEFARS